MKNDSKFLRLDNASSAPTVVFHWEGQAITAREGDTIAAALLAAGVDHTRETPATQSPRAPFCMMGSCFECRVEVDGEPNVQGCMRQVAPGIQVKRQRY
ncbi:(2Fe-2S)-binding protein [Photobacterium sp. TY1-4]|uniref:(2Fe-2S)-binding protein n=1 Tax=Photobacterium sp. TY1-4 TaxID=2899122 RepID=UPI0021C1FF7D|nr:(2Fe-2S)-binding protein [Photobacterium sp. TY1-4]UXI03278.1 (2Fe-2S)-binding protein [Photobacterium sp. TY1-4]